MSDLEHLSENPWMYAALTYWYFKAEWILFVFTSLACNTATVTMDAGLTYAIRIQKQSCFL